MDAPLYVGLALFIAVGWWTTLERSRINMYIFYFRMSEEEARTKVRRPAYRAGLWACRIMSVVLAAGLIPLTYLGMHDQSIYAFFAAVCAGATSWLYFYWRLSKGA